MIDRDKVIRGLECCIALDGGTMRRSCESCPYNDDPANGTCISIIPLLEDALALLKADQAYLMWLAHALRMIADDTNLYKITESTARKPIDEMLDIALHGVPEEVTVDAE